LNKINEKYKTIKELEKQKAILEQQEKELKEKLEEYKGG